jgi:aminoglycoside phosphotransferase (APT) family kinase protein
VVDRQALFTGTEAPPAHLQLDTARLATVLAGRIDGLGADFTLEKFKGGQSNPTYKLVDGASGNAFVLRRRPPGPLVASAHDIAREYRVMHALSTVAYPVPRCHLLCEDEGVIGSAFYIVGFNAGTVFWNADIPGMAPVDRAALYDDMSARLAELHAVDPASLALADLSRAGGYAARNLSRWSKVYAQSRLVDVPDMDWLMTRLPDMVPSDERIALLHGDYGLYNIVAAADPLRVDAVLDWEMSTIGDPFVDLAHHLRAWWEPQDSTGAASSLRERDLAALGIPTMDAYIDLYCRRRGLAELPHRAFYLGFAQFRYAAMIQGILKRAAIGTASSRRVLHTQDRVFEVAAMARATIAGAG